MITAAWVYKSIGDKKGVVIGDLWENGISTTFLVEIISVYYDMSFCVIMQLTVEFYKIS